MNQGPLASRLIDAFESLSGELQKAARYVLDHPRDVALLSMREQARRAGIKPATMTRLAQHLKLEGYDAVRSMYAEAIRAGVMDFSSRAGRQVAAQKLKGDQALAAEMARTLGQHLAGFCERDMLERLAAAGAAIASARNIYCLGLRSSFPIAWYFRYTLSLARENVHLIDTLGGLGLEQLRDASSRDVLLVVSVHPYTRATVDAAKYAAGRKIPVVAITDSEVAPLASVARRCVLAPIESPSYFHSMTPAFAAAEMLTAIVAGRAGASALATLRRTEDQLASFRVHVDRIRRKRSR